ncbi:MAG: TonB-dependent receptor plug domain-containing protein, partial [Cyanobacteria bacterium P01_H01_bin.150]
MKLKKFWYAGILGIFYLTLSQTALATEKQTKIDNQDKILVKEKAEKSISNILQLNQIQLPKTSASYLLTQENTTPAITQITDVTARQTTNGLEIVLGTNKGDLPLPTTEVNGNTLVANIKNAVLSLSDGRKFQTKNPLEGIASITVTQLANKVQIRITGVENAPIARFTNSQAGLTLSLDSTPQADIELTVTAQKRPEEAQNVPLSLTVIPQQEIEDAQIDSFQDIADYTPNFRFAPTSSGGTEFSNYSMRGVNNANFLTAQDSVAFYIDDVPVDYNGFLDLAFTDLERIEVLRGPQSTLYGKNSSAGVVNVISRQATLEPEVTFGLGYGRYNHRELKFSLNDALVEDKLALRIAGAYRGQDGFIENLATGETIGERARFAGRAQLLWTPTLDWTVSFNSYNSFTNDGNPTYNKINPDDPFVVN